MRERGNNNAFFRASANPQVEKHRIWLNLANAQGGFSQILIGYAQGASNSIDRSYDGQAFSGNDVSFYSINTNKNLTIQGRKMPFEQNDQVQLGCHLATADTYTIGIDHLDGLFTAQNIYLEDKILNRIHDLKQSAYSFASTEGTFNNRFVLRYNTTSLGISDANFDVIILIKNKKIIIQASENIKTIQVYDITGKLVKKYSPNELLKNFEDDFVFAQGLYIAKVKLESNNTVTKKLVN